MRETRWLSRILALGIVATFSPQISVGAAPNNSSPLRRDGLSRRDVCVIELPPVGDAVWESPSTLETKDPALTQRRTANARRIGVFQDIPGAIRVEGINVTDGAWQDSPDQGLVWSVVIYSPGAAGQRVHFRRFRLPQGAQVIIYNNDEPTESYGPYTEPDLGSGGLWSATCFSDAVRVECYLPPGISQEEVFLEIDRIVHVFSDFTSVFWAKEAGSCNLDVSCYTDWATTALGVAGIGTIGEDGFLWCTGTLLADLDPSTDKPYFLTANHCVGTPCEASTVEVYWFYQTSACNAGPPDPARVPRTTGGAFYLAGVSDTAGTDFTLLRLRNKPPAGVNAIGWTTTPPALGQQVVAIHHPDGDFKRISFGTVQSLDAKYIEVVWDNGTTEPGSSGCPLFDVGQNLVGQLMGGTASCELPQEPDFFGRFDSTYPAVRAYLDPSAGPLPAPDAPTEVTASDGAFADAVVVRWKQVENAYEYQVWRGDSEHPGEAAPLTDWLCETGYRDTSVEPVCPLVFACPAPTDAAGRVYYYYVKARNDWGESSLSAPDAGSPGQGTGRDLRNSFDPAQMPWGIVVVFVILAGVSGIVRRR